MFRGHCDKSIGGKSDRNVRHTKMLRQNVAVRCCTIRIVGAAIDDHRVDSMLPEIPKK